MNTKFVWGGALVLAFAGGCAVAPSPVVRPQPPAATWRAVGLVVRGVAGARCSLQDVPGWTPAAVTNADGYLAWLTVTGGLRQTAVRCQADGFVAYEAPAVLTTGEDEDLPPIALQAAHVDPSGIPLEELARVRGSMWTARYPLPWGPRPNAPDNILSLPSVRFYPDAAQRDPAYASYTAHGYTHAVNGPWQPDQTGGGYHGRYPDTYQTFDDYLDQLQEYWDHGLTPVCFIKPDNWTIDQLETLTPLYSTPRAQRLVRFAVIAWEPSEDTSNAEWVRWAQWLARVLPHAVRAIHMAADFDAPGNNEDFTPSSPTFIGMPKAWANLAPYLHGYLMQNGGYVFGGSDVPTAEFTKNFCGLFDPNQRGSITDRFEHGYAGWPTGSAWGPTTGLLLWAAEYAAYADYWHNYAEQYARDLGDLAMRCGAAGYLDGGRVAVPRPR